MRTGRLNGETLDRAVDFGVRVLSVVAELETARRPRRVIDQLTGSGTSPGAQLFEANEAVSKADFVKSLGWAAKEFSETQYWLRVIIKSGWIKDSKLDPLLDETIQLLRITITLIARARRSRPPVQ